MPKSRDIERVKNSKRFGAFTTLNDPFNPKNMLTGNISFEHGTGYGAMKISEINGEKVNHPTIYGTPKIAYPFGLGHNYKFPSASEIHRFRKYDGTNVFMYRYEHNSELFTSYKVRLAPFVRGRYLVMWREMLNRYPQIPELFKLNPDIKGFSFELYGNMNQHMIQYENDLDVVLLFGIKDRTSIVMPTDIESAEVPTAEHLGCIDRDYVWNYEQEQEAYDADLKFVSNNMMEQSCSPVFIGEEGSVWYMRDKTSGEIRMFKCKPHQIEQVNWAHTKLNTSVIKATVLNSLESWETPTIEDILVLLKEQYPIHQIATSMNHIENTFHQVKYELLRRKKVRELMELEGFDHNTDVPTILRKIKFEFDREEMSLVYNSVKTIQKFMKIEDQS